MKNKYKTESRYTFTIEERDIDQDILQITQEENVKDRNAIKINFYQERWRTPEDTVEFLEKIIKIVKDNFVK